MRPCSPQVELQENATLTIMEIQFLYTETCTNPTRARDVFREMRDIGADSVVICVYEQDLLRWTKDLPRLFDEAAKAGLRRYVSYGRFGGAFSGALMVPSLFTFLRPDTGIVPSDPKKATDGEADVAASEYFHRISCVNHPAFRKYMADQTHEILTTFQPDGLLFDEPKGLRLVCECKHCIAARKKDETPAEANLRFQVEFVRALADQAKAHRDGICTALVVGSNDDDSLASFARIRSLDVLGTEAYWVNRRKDMRWLRAWCPKEVQRLRSLGKKAQVWAGNYGLARAQQEDLAEMYRIIADAQPDQLANFWWWRGSEDPERVMELTKRGIQEVRSGAIHRAEGRGKTQQRKTAR